MKNTILLITFVALITSCNQQLVDKEIKQQEMHPEFPLPSSLENLSFDKSGRLIFTDPDSGIVYDQKEDDTIVTITNFRNNVVGTNDGIAFDFHNSKLEGKLFVGFIYNVGVKYEQPIFSKKWVGIKQGKAFVKIKGEYEGKYDIVDWVEKKKFKMGYRVMLDDGQLLYDGKINIKGNGPFQIDISIIEGPFLNVVTDSSAIISFTTNEPKIAKVEVNDREFITPDKSTNHEILIDGLKPLTNYKYIVRYGSSSDEFNFTTNPKLGTKDDFKFCFASDCRAGAGGGERSLGGVNSYILKRVANMAISQGAKFVQFTGDLISGYRTNVNQTRLEFSNWKRTVEPFAAYIPYIATMGNHEAILYNFSDKKTAFECEIARFPFDNQSAESIFSEFFINPLNGPDSEDGSRYDPNPNTLDFPSYKENAFYYTYANVAIICLNSNYWYAPSKNGITKIGGNPHGYLMDNQIKWLEQTILMFENDNRIDHVFVTVHTPAFPNGGHINDDMWYGGNNKIRPFVAGTPVEKGIIERRDDFLDLIINGSNKVLAILAGDEHNYSRMRISPDIDMYPPQYNKPKLNLKRSIWQITNGSAGAPYYAQENVPWTRNVEKFTPQFALVFFDISGNDVWCEVHNPDTNELIERVKLK